MEPNPHPTPTSDQTKQPTRVRVRDGKERTRRPPSLSEFEPGQPMMAILSNLKPGSIFDKIVAAPEECTPAERARSRKALLEVQAFCHEMLAQGWTSNPRSEAEAKELARRFPPELFAFLRGEWAQRGAAFLASREVDFAGLLMEGRPVFVIEPNSKTRINRLALRAERGVRRPRIVRSGALGPDAMR